MAFNKKLEEKIKSVALQYLKKCRPGWDILHTFASVYWMKQLLKHEKADPKILIPAIYLHDIGSADMFKKRKSNFKNQMELKAEHMKRGATLTEKILKNIKEFSPTEIKKIVHLVRIHDELEKIITKNEQLVFEADCLGQIDQDRVKPTFSKSDYLKFLNHFKTFPLDSIFFLEF